MRRSPKSITTTPDAHGVSHKVPEILQGKEVDVWKRLMKFIGKKPMHELTRDACLRYCQLQAHYDLCQCDIAKRGVVVTAKNGYETANPSLKTLLSINDRLRRLAHDLGLVDEMASKDPANDPEWKKWEEFL